MNPQAALESPVFRFYAVLILTLLAIAGIVLGVLKFIFKKDVAAVWKIYRGWLMMVPLILGCILAGRTATIVGLTFLSGYSFKEFARATGLYRDWWMTCAVYVAITACGVFSLMADPFSGKPGWYGTFMALPVYAITVLLMIPVFRNEAKGQLQAVCLAIVGFLYIGWMFGHFAFLANADHAYAYLLFLVFAVEINDISAFVFGKLFGRIPLRSNISPKKTWAGALGALAVSMTLPWIFGFTLPHFGTIEKLICGLIIGIGGQLGDLTMSFIKRDIGIKDMGATIPGHGGLLDRIDSLIYVSPLFFHMIKYFHEIR